MAPRIKISIFNLTFVFFSFLTFVNLKSMINNDINLLKNVHINLKNPTNDGETYLIQGIYEYYHYGCDDFKDMGWGCGYRTLQTICSWIINTKKINAKVPNIFQIQQILHDLEDKPKEFVGSREWIGSFEVCLVIDHLYDIPSKLIHLRDKNEIRENLGNLIKYFKEKHCPIMMGGDQDCSSKGVLGLHIHKNDIYLLILDPHFIGKASSKNILEEKWVKWIELSEFSDSSFYNLCLPQI